MSHQGWIHLFKARSRQGPIKIFHINSSSRDEKRSAGIFSLFNNKTNPCLFQFLPLKKQPDLTEEKLFQSLQMRVKDLYMNSQSSSKPTKLLKMIPLTAKKYIQGFSNSLWGTNCKIHLCSCFFHRECYMLEKLLLLSF